MIDINKKEHNTTNPIIFSYIKKLKTFFDLNPIFFKLINLYESLPKLPSPETLKK